MDPGPASLTTLYWCLLVALLALQVARASFKLFLDIQRHRSAHHAPPAGNETADSPSAPPSSLAAQPPASGGKP